MQTPRYISVTVGVATVVNLWGVAARAQTTPHGTLFPVSQVSQPLTAKATPAPAPTPTSSNPSSDYRSGLVIDCKTKRAYASLPFPDPVTGHGRLAVIDLTKNPDNGDPRIGTVRLPNVGAPSSLAVDQTAGIVFVPTIVGSSVSLDLLKESNDTAVSGSPFSLPLGAYQYGISVAFDPLRRRLIVEGGAGFVLFDESSHSFGPIIQEDKSLGPFGSFAFNPATNVILAPNTAVDVTYAAVCNFEDAYFDESGEGTLSFDPTTNLVIGAAYEFASIVNLNGSTFSSRNSPCVLREAGKSPNSIIIDGLSGFGSVAVHPTAHLAFLASEGDAVGVMQLPGQPVRQLAQKMVSVRQSAIPNDPNNGQWENDSLAIANCPNGRNYGYVVNYGFSFLAQIDLGALAADPVGLSAPLPPGNCTGTDTTLACSNGRGITFFPLPNE